MMEEERPGQYNIDDTAYNNYIGTELIMGAPVEGLIRASFRCLVENLDGAKVITYHWNPLMDTREYKLEYDDVTHDH